MPEMGVPIDPSMGETFTVMSEFGLKLGKLREELLKKNPNMPVNEMQSELFERMRELYGSLVYNPLFKQMIDAESGMSNIKATSEALVAVVKSSLKKIANKMDDMGLVIEATVIDDISNTF